MRLTGLTFLGYHDRPPGLRLVDVDGRTSAPAATSLPGNASAVRDILAREDWVAVNTGTVWSVPPGLDGSARPLVDTFTFVPTADGGAVWVDPPGGPPHGDDLVAVDGQGRVVDRVSLPAGWRLVSETSAGFVIEDSAAGRLAVFDRSGGQRTLVDGVQPVRAAGGGSRVAWIRKDDPAVLGLADLATGRTHEIRRPDVAEWQWLFGSFSPDGGFLAIGAYLEPAGPPPVQVGVGPYLGRRAFMMLVDTATGECRRMEGEFDNFAWTPAWSADGSWVVFGAPFERRRLYAFRPDEGVLHRIAFRANPAMPMLDVTGRVGR